jgi:hypothetical protein
MVVAGASGLASRPATGALAVDFSGLPTAYFSHPSRLQSETRKITDRGHALAIGSAWRDVDTALAFVKRFV